MAVLEITFTGLFLFVPDTAAKHLHVLLPATGGTTGVPLHKASIGDLGTGSTTPLDGVSVTLSATGGTRLLPPREAIDIEEITVGKRFPRGNLIKENLRPRIHARLRLPLATSMEPGQTADWTIGNLGTRTLTHRIFWTLDGLAGTSVTFKQKPFGGTETDLVFDADAQGLVRLCIQHLPEHTEGEGGEHERGTHAHAAELGMEAKHFAAYYKSDAVFGTGPIPVLAQEPGEPQQSECDGIINRNADTFTCMVAQVRAG